MEKLGMETYEFDFQGVTVRAVECKGVPWFSLADVHVALYGSAVGQHGRRFLGEDEYLVVRKGSAAGALSSLFVGRSSSVALVSESGLYKLIMRSDKPEAKAFQDWVTREVLPAVRKTGGYLLNEEARDTAKADDRANMPMPEGLPRHGTWRRSHEHRRKDSRQHRQGPIDNPENLWITIVS